MWKAAEPGHGDALAFSPDGEVLAGGNTPWNVTGAGIVGLWRAADGAPLQALSGHASTASSIAFSPDGDLMATGGENVRLWCRR